MLASYTRKSNIAAAVFIACIVGDVVLISSGHRELWDNDVFAAVLGLTFVTSYLYAVWAYVKAKGRSGAWVLLGVFLSVIGLTALLLLKDLHKERTEGAASETVP